MGFTRKGFRVTGYDINPVAPNIFKTNNIGTVKNDVPDEEQAKKQGLKYPALIITLNSIEKHIFHSMMSTTERLTRKQLLKKAKKQNILGYNIRINRKSLRELF